MNWALLFFSVAHLEACPADHDHARKSDRTRRALVAGVTAPGRVRRGSTAAETGKPLRGTLCVILHIYVFADTVRA